MMPEREDWIEADEAFNASMDADWMHDDSFNTAMDEEREWTLYTDPAMDEVLDEDYTLLPEGVLFSDIGDEWTY